MPTPIAVLLIEDAEDDVLLIVSELRRGGYVPTWERVDTAAALRAALAQREWDLISCDWVMPQFSAPAALAQIRESGTDVPIIIVSGEVGEEVAVSAMKAGAHDFVSKHRLTRLVPAVERELREAQSRRERRQAEEALRTTEERLRVALSNSPVRAFSQDRDLRFTWVCNPAFGRTPDQVVGRMDADLVDARDAAVLTAIKRRVLETGIKVREEVCLTHDGDARYFDFAIEPLRNARGAIVGLTGVAADITERKRAEEALQRSEQLFRSLIENAQDLVSILNRDGTARYVSPSHTRILGYQPEELIGRHPWNFVHPDDLPKVATLMRWGVETPGATGIAEFRFRHKDGSWRVLEGIATNLLDDPVVAGIVANSRDVTDRKRAERALEDVSTRLALMLEQMPLLVWTTDTELRCTWIGGAGLAQQDLQAEEVIGRTLRDLVETSDAGLRGHRRALAGESGRYEYTWRDRTYNAHVEPLRDRAGTITGVIGIAEDITAQQRAADERARLGVVIEQAAEAVMITDASGVVVYVNPASERLTGYTRAEVCGQPAAMLRGQWRSQESYQRLVETLARGEVWRGTEIYRRKDGSLYEVESIISPVYDSAGRLINFVGLARDVTRERQVEAQLRQAQRLEAVGRLAGGVAHEFNNQLTVIKASLQLLLAQLPADDPRRKEADRVRASAEKSAQLVRQLLTLSRQQPMETQALDLNVLVKEMEPILHLLLGGQITLRVRAAARLARVDADRSQIEQVMINLVANARDAIAPQGTSTAGGTVLLETADVELDEQSVDTVIGPTKPGRYVMLAVSDDGCGILPEVREHLFEPFFTTKEVGKGTGLGLATVFGVVKQHRGYVTCASETGQGSVFRVYLPAELNRRADPILAPPTDSARPARPALVLVVDDDEQICELVVRCLAAAGHRAHGSGSAREALALATRLDGPIDLLVTDVVMPGPSGPALAQQLLREHSDMRVLFISGYTADIVGRSDLTAARFLPKPFDIDALLRTVNELLSAD